MFSILALAWNRVKTWLTYHEHNEDIVIETPIVDEPCNMIIVSHPGLYRILTNSSASRIEIHSIKTGRFEKRQCNSTQDYDFKVMYKGPMIEPEPNQNLDLLLELPFYEPLDLSTIGYNTMSPQLLKYIWELNSFKPFGIKTKVSQDLLLFFDTEWEHTDSPAGNDLWLKVQNLTEISWMIVDYKFQVIKTGDHICLKTESDRNFALFDFMSDLVTYTPIIIGYNNHGFDEPAIVHKFPNHPVCSFFGYSTFKSKYKKLFPDTPGYELTAKQDIGYVSFDLLQICRFEINDGKMVSLQNNYKNLIDPDFVQRHTAMDDVEATLELFKAVLKYPTRSLVHQAQNN